MIHIVKGFGIVNKAEIYIFLEKKINAGLIYMFTIDWQTWLYIHALKIGTFVPAEDSPKELNPMDTKPGQVNSFRPQAGIIKLRYSDVILFP